MKGLDDRLSVSVSNTRQIMASPGLKDVTTTSDMAEQDQEYHERVGVNAHTAEEIVSVASKTTTGGESHAVEELTTLEETPTATTLEETPTATTVGETPKAATDPEHEISKVFLSTASISAVAMAEIADTIAASDRLNMDTDYSVAATVGSSIDGESVRTEDFAEEEVFVEESSKEAEVDFAELAAADDDMEEKDESDPSEIAETTEGLTSVGMTTETKSTTPKVESVIEEAFQAAVTTETKATAETKPGVAVAAIDTTAASSEVGISEGILTKVSPGLSGGVHAQSDSPESASTIPDTASEMPEKEAEVLETLQLNCSSPMTTRVTEYVPLTMGSHRTDSVAQLELNSPSPVESIIHSLEVHETVSPQTHRTPSAAYLDLSGASPVKSVVHRLETHQEEDNALEGLRIRTKRDFFSEKGRSISVSHEKEKYNAQMVQRAKKEAEAKEQLKSPGKKHCPVSRKNSAMSSVRNMASRFEKKADQSLDNLSFRTVRSFFPTEKSIHVGTEKQKLEALEKEKLSIKETEEKFAYRMCEEPRISSDLASVATEMNERVTEEPLVEDTVIQEAPLISDISTPTKSNEMAILKANRTPESHPRRHTVTTSPNVRGIAYRFETKRANSVVTAPVRTIDTFIVADSEASVRVLAEKEKYENQVKPSAPTKRAIDTFIVPKSEASVCVSAETAKFETPENQVRATKRAIDTFIVPESKASVRVSAEKAKFESPEKFVKATVRTIDTFIVPDSEASIRVSAEKAKFESPEQQMQLTGPVVRTIDTFIVPESEVSVRVGAEKAKLEALEKQKQSELEARAAIVKQKLERTVSFALEKDKWEKASQSIKEVKTVEDITKAHEVEEVEAVEETDVATEMEVTIRVEADKEIKETEKTEVTLRTGMALDTSFALITEAVTQATAAKAVEIRERDVAVDIVTNEEAEVEIGVGKDEETDVVKVKEVGKPTEVAARTKEARENEKMTESGVAVERTDEIEGTTAKEAEEVKKTETKVAKVSGVVDTAEVAKEMAYGSEKAKVTEVVTKTELVAEIKVASETKIKQAAKDTEENKRTEMKEIMEAKEIEGAPKIEDVQETEEENETKGAEVVEVVEEASQTEEVKEMEVTTVRKENGMVEVDEKVKEVMKEMMVETVKKSDVLIITKEAKVTEEEVDDIVQRSKEAEVVEVVKEIEEVTEAGEATECEVVKTVEAVKVVNETASEEEKGVQHISNPTIPVVEVTVERQTFGDIVSTAQHVHWLSLPVSVNPALARLHTVLSDHDPLTAYALYPSSPPSPSSRSR